MREQGSAPAGLACNMSAIPREQRDAHQALGSELFGRAAQETAELADGYAFRFPAERYADITAFIANERLCCPFFAFTLEVAADRGPIWLRITGREGAKEVMRAELSGIT